MIRVLACIAIIIALVAIAFNLKNRQREQGVQVPVAIPSLNLTNPREILQPGSCQQDSDCGSDMFHCLGNTCVLKPDAPLDQVCNSDHGCYNAISGISSIGSILNICLPLTSQWWNSNNCNTQNPYNCQGTIQDGKCIPEGTKSVLYYSTFGGREVIPVTLSSQGVANLFRQANPILSA